MLLVEDAYISWRRRACVCAQAQGISSTILQISMDAIGVLSQVSTYILIVADMSYPYGRHNSLPLAGRTATLIDHLDNTAPAIA